MQRVWGGQPRAPIVNDTFGLGKWVTPDQWSSTRADFVLLEKGNFWSHFCLSQFGFQGLLGASSGERSEMLLTIVLRHRTVPHPTIRSHPA